MIPFGILTCVSAFLVPLVSSQFITPLTQRQQFRVGEVQKIQYRTKLTNYTIAIWQQQLAGGSANLGPVVFRTTDGPETEFDWQVQLYSFDLAVSNVFFFWLKEGGLENLGSVEVEAMSSAYFNITDEPLPSSSPSIPSTSTSPPSSTTASASSTITSLSTTSSGEHQKGTTSSTPAPSELENSGLNLPVAAQAGIGVGVSIVGLTAIVCGILWFRYVRKQQRMLLELQQQQRVYSQPLDDVEMLKSQTPPLPPPPPFRYHSNATGRSTPVELG